MNTPRRLLSEIALRCRLEPDLNDIYVEGRSDKWIIDKAMAETKIQRVTYEIDTIDIPFELLDKHGLTEGSKQRVIALCLELNLAPPSLVRFLVDQDMDNILSRTIDRHDLLYTTYIDLEGFFVESDIIEDLFTGYCRAKCDNWPFFFRSLKSTASDIYALRLALEECGFRGALPSLEKSLRKVSGFIEVDLANLCLRIQNLRTIGQTVVTILDRTESWRRQLRMNPEISVFRGHDFFTILSWSAKNFGAAQSKADNLHDILYLITPKVAFDIADMFKGSLE